MPEDKEALTAELRALLEPMTRNSSVQMKGCGLAIVFPIGAYVVLAHALALSTWRSLALSLGATVLGFVVFFAVTMTREERLAGRALKRFNERYPRGSAQRATALGILGRLADPYKSYFMPSADTLLRALNEEADLHGETPKRLWSPPAQSASETAFDDGRSSTAAAAGPPVVPLEPERDPQGD